MAAELGNVDALAWLIEHGQMHGVDFNAKDAKGRTPLDVAALYNKRKQSNVLKICNHYKHYHIYAKL